MCNELGESDGIEEDDRIRIGWQAEPPSCLIQTVDRQIDGSGAKLPVRKRGPRARQQGKHPPIVLRIDSHPGASRLRHIQPVIPEIANRSKRRQRQVWKPGTISNRVPYDLEWAKRPSSMLDCDRTDSPQLLEQLARGSMCAVAGLYAHDSVGKRITLHAVKPKHLWVGLTPKFS